MVQKRIKCKLGRDQIYNVQQTKQMEPKTMQKMEEPQDEEHKGEKNV